MRAYSMVAARLFVSIPRSGEPRCLQVGWPIEDMVWQLASAGMRSIMRHESRSIYYSKPNDLPGDT